MTDLMDTALGGIGQLPLWAVLVAVCLVMALGTTMPVGIVVPGDLASWSRRRRPARPSNWRC